MRMFSEQHKIPGLLFYTNRKIYFRLLIPDIMNKPFRIVTVLLLYIVTITSCRKDTENTRSDGSEFFVSATSTGTYPKEILQALALTNGFGSYVSQIKYDVSFYKFVYKTTYKGKSLDASGLLAVPKKHAWCTIFA